MHMPHACIHARTHARTFVYVIMQREREGETEISQGDVDKTLRYLGQRYCDVVNFNQSFQRHSAKQSLLLLIAKLSLLDLIFLNSTGLTHQMC